MKIALNTDVLVRSVIRDDERQADAAIKLLKNAQVIAVALPSLCEFVWVLRRVYGLDDSDIAAAIRALLEAENVAVNRPAVDAGLAMLDAGGDFADGIIAYEGKWLGGDTFVSFDKKAVTLIEQQGQHALLLS
jgi:predicted nucleic-acid-binding protein